MRSSIFSQGDYLDFIKSSKEGMASGLFAFKDVLQDRKESTSKEDCYPPAPSSVFSHSMPSVILLNANKNKNLEDKDKPIKRGFGPDLLPLLVSHSEIGARNAIEGRWISLCIDIVSITNHDNDINCNFFEPSIDLSSMGSNQMLFESVDWFKNVTYIEVMSNPRVACWARSSFKEGYPIIIKANLLNSVTGYCEMTLIIGVTYDVRSDAGTITKGTFHVDSIKVSTSLTYHKIETHHEDMLWQHEDNKYEE